MNATALAFGLPSQDLRSTIGGAFFGFTLGAMYVLSKVTYERCLGFNDTFRRHRLFGITLRQAYQYYTTNINDSMFRKSLVRYYSFIYNTSVVKSVFRNPRLLSSGKQSPLGIWTFTWTRLSYSSLDLLNLLFGVYMVYAFILLLIGYTDQEPHVLWCVCFSSWNLTRWLTAFVIGASRY